MNNKSKLENKIKDLEFLIENMRDFIKTKGLLKEYDMYSLEKHSKINVKSSVDKD